MSSAARPGRRVIGVFTVCLCPQRLRDPISRWCGRRRGGTRPPVAFSNGDGTWSITNGEAAPFVGGDQWASGPGVRVITGELH